MKLGDHATFWHRKRGSNRSSRVWCTVLEVSGEYAIVKLPTGWPTPTRRIPLKRLTYEPHYGTPWRKS